MYELLPFDGDVFLVVQDGILPLRLHKHKYSGWVGGGWCVGAGGGGVSQGLSASSDNPSGWEYIQ